MKQTLNTSQAIDCLLRDKNASWSYKGAKAIVEHLEQLELETGEEIELDPCAIRCDCAEYESLEAWAEEYGFQPDGDDEQEREDSIRNYIELHGQLIEFSGGVIVSQF